MFGDSTQGAREGRRRDANGLRPTLEGLEQRLLLYSTLGGEWAYGSRITYSFPPDGANVGGVPNALSQAMAGRGITEAQWKAELRRAFAVWQSAANINLAEVPDSGASLGVPGNQQNDSRFGDIRVFATPQQPGVLGYAFAPPPINGGTRAGDVVLNSSAAWNVGSTFDLQTVAIHEVGHALGLGHSSISTAAMYDVYNGLKQGIISDDINGLRSLYGARQQDWLDQYRNNKDPWNAINVSGYLDASGRVTLPSLDVTSNQDDDWFYVKAPSNASGTMVITMQAKDLSSLSPRFEVYNSALQLAGWTVSPNPSTTYGSTISLQFTGVPAGTGVYINARGWNAQNSGVNGIGAYALRVDFSGGPVPPAIVSPPGTTVPEKPDQGGGSIALAAPDPAKGGGSWRKDATPAPSPIGLSKGTRFSTWETPDNSDPSYGTVAFRSPDRPGLGRVFEPTTAFAAPSPWFVQAIDAALEEVEGDTPPSKNARLASWIDEVMTVELPT
ncbi:matrixin family metalloprotease [Tautonia plasticadhaerens]|uniref:Matrixin n=1 Tax=Tautonia plasticadhaerens TaxID=2527974 RepID=A0A518GVW1_9BACT|nr:matrixin family metalloprotease [Tautonia plasticadhaerens]QDV32734.1 Matrixin [Tautonia plasticadhaerens]